MAYIRINFFVRKQRVSENLVRCVVDTLMSTGMQYIQDLGYSRLGDVRSKTATLDEAINAIGRDQGVLHFYHDGFNYDVRLLIAPEIGNTLGLISLRTEINAFTSHYADNYEVARHLIGTVVAVWNGLSEQPIYGCGDTEFLVPGMSDEEDASLKNLDIKINYYWLNFYSTFLMKKYAKDILKKGAEEVVELTGGLLCINDGKRQDWTW